MACSSIYSICNTKRFIKKSLPISTELFYIKRSVYPKFVPQQCEWDFELGIETEIFSPIQKITEVQQRKRTNNQHLRFESFYRSNFPGAPCKNETEKLLESGISLISVDDKIFHGFTQIFWEYNSSCHSSTIYNTKKLHSKQ